MEPLAQSDREARLRVVMVLAKWAMFCLLFHLAQAERHQQLRLERITHVHCSTTREWCVGVTTRMANLVKEAWTTLAMVLGQPLLQHQQLI
jgi:hypothetical protein